jgi:hypothetical protein
MVVHICSHCMDFKLTSVNAQSASMLQKACVHWCANHPLTSPAALTPHAADNEGAASASRGWSPTRSTAACRRLLDRLVLLCACRAVQKVAQKWVFRNERFSSRWVVLPLNVLVCIGKRDKCMALETAVCSSMHCSVVRT